MAGPAMLRRALGAAAAAALSIVVVSLDTCMDNNQMKLKSAD